MHLKGIRAFVLGVIAAGALAIGAGSAAAQSATITITTTSAITATSSGKLTLNDNALGTITCNVQLNGAVTSGVFPGTGTTLLQIGAFTGGSMTNCNQGLTAALLFPSGGWSLNVRANDLTFSGGNITNADFAIGGAGFSLSGAAVGGTVLYGGTANPGILTPQIQFVGGYPIAQNVLHQITGFAFSNANGGNSLNSNLTTVGSLIGTLNLSTDISDDPS